MHSESPLLCSCPSASPEILCPPPLFQHGASAGRQELGQLPDGSGHLVHLLVEPPLNVCLFRLEDRVLLLQKLDFLLGFMFLSFCAPDPG